MDKQPAIHPTSGVTAARGTEEKFLMSSMEKSAQSLSKWFCWVAMCALVALMLLPVVNITMRLLPWTKPLKGTFELVGFFSGIVSSFGFAYCATKKGHIDVELLYIVVPKRLQVLMDTISSFLSSGMCLLIVWQSLEHMVDMWHGGETTMDLHIPLATILAGIACGFAALFLVYLVELFQAVARGIKS